MSEDQMTTDDSWNGWKMYEHALENDTVIYVYGPPGVGKTYLSYNHSVGERMLFALTLGEEASSVELRGHYLPKGSEAVWHDGVFSLAMRATKGARLVINEITNASPDVQGMLYPILEDPSTAKFTLPTGETLSPGENFQVVMTDNYPPDRIPTALRDRVETFVALEEPHKDALELLEPALRDLALKSIKTGRVGFRSWLHFGNKLKQGVPLDRAVGMSFGIESEVISSYIAEHKATSGWNPEVPAACAPAPDGMIRPVGDDSSVGDCSSLYRDAQGILRVNRSS